VIIVSTFMLGLGCGALIGGQLADRFSDRIVSCSPPRACIALFGFASPWLLAVGEPSSARVVVIAVVPCCCYPATLMGATLPMLVAHVRRLAQRRRVDRRLYLVNTLGAAFGALATGIVSSCFPSIRPSTSPPA
jgi:MFS family permease